MAKEIIRRTEKDITELGFDYIDIFDSQYDALNLKSINNEKQKEADSVLSLFADVLRGKDVLAKLKDKGYEYVADISEEMMDAIDKGKAKLDTGKDGQIYAQFRVGNEYGKKIPLKKVLKDNGMDPMQVASALQMKAIENKLESIIGILNSIGDKVEELDQGQRNDRVALFYSGMNIYLEARAIIDPDLKRVLVSQALKAISDSNSQILQQLQSDARYLMTKQYSKKKGNSYQELREHMVAVNQGFEAIYKSYMLKAAIYYDQNELPAMMTALDEYSRFIEKVIVPIAPKLTELDENVTEISGGAWEKRVESLSAVNDLRKTIESNHSFMLELGQDETRVDGEDSRTAKFLIKEVKYG